MATIVVAACGSNEPESSEALDASTTSVDASTDPPAPPTFSVGGTVKGLLGTGLVLQNNLGDDIPIAKDGSFSFGQKLTAGAKFSVSIKAQPTAPSQSCTVSGESGTIASGNVTTVLVNCTTDKFSLGGTVSGVVGAGLVLQNNGADALILGANGTFAFPTPIASGTTYAVAVKTQPTNPMQVCAISGGTGTIVAGDVTGVAVNCTNKYSIGGTVTGLAGTVYLQNNAGNDLMLNANGTFAFSTPLSSGATYAVTVRTQPSTPKQVCTLSNQTGTVATSHITNIALNCVTSAYKVKATVSGLAAGASVVLQNNNADDLSITSNGAFTFATSVPSGQTYSVTVKTPPTSPSQTCTVTNGTGTISAADISNVTVACVTDKFTVGGSVAGLSGAGLVLQNNLGDNLSVNAPGGSFTFATKVTSGQPYSVTVKTQPTNPSQKCTVSAGTGTVTKGNVVTVTVNCVSMYTVGGAVSGLSGTGLVLQNNLGDDLTVNGDNSFAFATPMASGQPYSVTVKTQPTNPDQTCTVDNGSGTVGGNVTNVTVTCVTN